VAKKSNLGKFEINSKENARAQKQIRKPTTSTKVPIDHHEYFINFVQNITIVAKESSTKIRCVTLLRADDTRLSQKKNKCCGPIEELPAALLQHYPEPFQTLQQLHCAEPSSSSLLLWQSESWQ
jgi:hypothetical protein